MRDEDYVRKPKEPAIPHYYGDMVRNLLLCASALLMISAALDEALFSFYAYIGIFVLLGLVILAGLTSPRRPLTIMADAILSGALLVFFQYTALLGRSSLAHSGIDAAFILRQLLAVLFLLSLYYSIKTWRGMST